MTEALFYHLERRPLEAVLPELLERSLSRGWRCVVQAGSPVRVEALDAHLWTYADDSFLPHAALPDEHAAAQPVILTHGPDNPNAATVRFLLDGAEPPDLAPYARAVFLFDGRDPEAVQAARQRWTWAKTAGHDCTYWQQDERGRWVKKA